MTETLLYDVAVIGYGPTGVTAANLLGQMGLKVLVIERTADIYRRARAISTDEEVLRIWQQVGLADRIQADMLPGTAAAFVDADGEPFVAITPVSHGSGHPPQQFLYQPALEKVLRGGVERFSNVEVRLEHECLRILQDASGVELMLADLRDDVFERVRASYVIAADGGASPTRAQLGVGYEGRTYAERWVVIDTKVLEEWPGHDRLRFHCNPARPTVDCPTPLGHHRWEFPVRDDEDETELVTEAAIWRVLNSQGITDTQVKILRAVVYSHHVRFADRWRIGRVFLAGDAAHAMPPWIGQGMSAGVRDVANLCWKLAAVLTGSLPESILDSYQHERMPHVREVTSRAVKVGHLITQRRPVLATLRNRFFRIAMRLPGFPEWLTAHRWIPDARYVQGLLATPKPAESSAVGWLIPQPWVLDEKGERERLDDVLGGRWTILHLGSADPWPGWRTVGVPAIRIAPAASTPTADTIVDLDGTLTRWMHAKGATVLALRPDSVVYAAAGPDTHLAPPPPGMKATPALHPSHEMDPVA
ncbi:FAD-binding monooxygenase [Rhodococcus ruber BKS 20-38]|uniref:FAD-binding monooxygenase n=1 Tax=Rhodococcus ruber BKS 20-38 TaxID=1278076 RepID=M2ZIB8_9NOCA|nr:bifunctional 3-(3-hydroxy-phenyl)propionate/3-hydroxycinnamic acid hydroxylase [Rhodococcus ruber]EME67057.1 FAD-binding monooxygenase [Rhodococcus ruber BKS 20-38]